MNSFDMTKLNYIQILTEILTMLVGDKGFIKSQVRILRLYYYAHTHIAN